MTILAITMSPAMIGATKCTSMMKTAVNNGICMKICFKSCFSREAVFCGGQESQASRQGQVSGQEGSWSWSQGTCSFKESFIADGLKRSMRLHF